MSDTKKLSSIIPAYHNPFGTTNGISISHRDRRSSVFSNTRPVTSNPDIKGFSQCKDFWHLYLNAGQFSRTREDSLGKRLGSSSTGTVTSDLTTTVTLSATTAATLATNVVVSSEQASTNDGTAPLGGATTVSFVTSPVTSPVPSTDLTGDVESSVISTGVLTPTKAVPKGSFTSMDSSILGTSAIDTQSPGSTGEPSTVPLTEPGTPESKPSTAVISPSDDTSSTLGRPKEGTTGELPPTSSYQSSRTETKPRATHKQNTSHTKASSVVVTGSGDAIATFAPAKDPEFTSLTKSTTATDDNDPVSTEESTTITTAESASEMTTSETTVECTVTKIPQCTKTISYITISQSVTSTEIGECPSTPSCATGEQSTVTTTLESESNWVSYVADPQQGPSEAELDAPIDEETEDALATATTGSTSFKATSSSSSGTATFTADEATATEAATKSEEVTSSTTDAGATPTVDPNYQPLVQQDPKYLKPAGGDHGAIDPGTQDDYAEEFRSQEPDGGWEAGLDIQHSYKETSHGVVYEYKVN
ncbi:hypothetical protein FGADI_1639 [Fusarium gaditjirri]|uniref:Uncharacterized protein n=1 Tax=Fusarium gaditjirri TaxID=282569 RepID=A0A8H4TKJ2_9HYPO|nr:hypothetical protein FGADI_1639 [Fusarium gaditjirri]